MAQEQFVEGWTERIEQQLLNNGTAVDMSSLSDSNIELELFDANHNLITIAGAVGFIDKTTSTVFYDPAGDDLLARYSPIRARWKITDGAGEVSFFPRGPADVWIVRKP